MVEFVDFNSSVQNLADYVGMCALTYCDGWSWNNEKELPRCNNGKGTIGMD